MHTLNNEKIIYTKYTQKTFWPANLLEGQIHYPNTLEPVYEKLKFSFCKLYAILLVNFFLKILLT